MQSSTGTWPKWMLWALAVLSVGAVIYVVQTVFSPLFFAFLMAYLLDPFVDKLEKRGIRRPYGISIILLIAAIVVGGVVFFLVPAIARDIAVFLAHLPERIDAALTRFGPLLGRYGIAVPHKLTDSVARFEGNSRSLANDAWAPVGAFMQWIIGGTASVVGALATLMVVPVFAFYLLSDFDKLLAAIRDLIPVRYRDTVVSVARDIDNVVSQFVRGQVIVMSILAVLYGVAYWIIGIPLALPIGLVAGALAFIPYVGSGTALTLALIMTIIDWQGWGRVLAVIVAYGCIQVAESFVITPLVVGQKVGLSSIWVLLALMVGSSLFGFAGVLLAVPAAAVAKIFIVRLVDSYKQSQFFNAERPSNQKE